MMAITFDDLPAVSVVRQDDHYREALTDRLLGAIGRQRVPAIGFVNEGKLFADGRLVPRRVELLQRWLAANLELGNHTYDHTDLHLTSLAEFERGVLEGEAVTRAMLAKAGRTPRYFRHPFLHTGRDLATKRKFEQFLHEHGYRVAPVTVDNYDYLFAAAYDRALEHGDSAGARAIAETFLEYMLRVVAYYEGQSRALFGREIPQVLLLHANWLNATHLDELVEALRARGYRFTTLDAALTDFAYRSQDEFVGPGGISWLHRWALTSGRRGAFFAGEPEVPKEIQATAQAR
jgi:peptidoglycan/xylan/chitin deacetylase (PgdA/CDA1 family)